MQITGRIARIIFHSERNGYTVAVFDTEDGACRIAGSINDPREGIDYRLEGHFVVHPKYGEQFAFGEYEEAMPEGSAAILEFLSSGSIRGIGPKLAAQIVDTFGDETMNILETNPDRLLCVNGIGRKTLARIKESFSESREFASISLELRDLGVAMNDAIRIYKMYGGESMEIIRSNPYVLADDIRGIDFHKADELAVRIGIDPDSDFRIESGIKYILQRWAFNGSTLMPKSLLIERVIETLDTGTERVEECLSSLVFQGEIQTEFYDGEEVIYLYGYYYAEQRVAQRLRLIAQAPIEALPVNIDNAINDAEQSLGTSEGRRVELSDEQRSAVRQALLDNVTIITGGPGTGKTTIINTIVRVFERLDIKVALAAPTGRAAKRMQEASGFPAMTIHRLLEYVYSEDEDELYFGRNEENPLDAGVVIVDEASMIDTLLMDGLLRAIVPGTRLIITGDADQLPSVGAGNVLRDIIRSERINTIRLKSIFRQAQGSRIVTNAHMINEGEYPEAGTADSDFFVMVRSSEDEIASTICELVSGRLENYYDFVNSASDIQILSPTKKGTLGSPNLNTLLQDVINPASEDRRELKAGGRTFREGDKVMQIKNNYNAEWRYQDDYETRTGIFNGDMGVIESIDTEGRSLLVSSDDRLIEYQGEMIDELELAYSITVHKSQGCEFPVVIVPIYNFPPMLMTRNLLYTAVTRGKQLVILVGSPRCLKWMIDNNRRDERHTGLSEQLELGYTGLA